MNQLKAQAALHGYSFSIDSEDSYEMESAAGRFCYIEDPDGTLLELVETHKIPIIKTLGWYINLKKEKSTNPLPKWMIALLGLGKI